MPEGFSIISSEKAEFHGAISQTFLPQRTRRTQRLLNTSHPVVIRAAAAFRRDPGDDLVRIHDVTGLAVYAVRWIQMNYLALGRGSVFFHLINVGGAEILAGIAELSDATRVADIGVMDDQVRRLIFFMLGAGVV